MRKISTKYRNYSLI